ncbi:class I SAM-dependent methyltransferase [Crossiella cryophila]|uniref:Ubiquinone/menaquinone biosynthesis C-methylase UbiE n=1 Tax=Crossiella cryophila TaxID=43355 RepID=A0A7W7CEX7_9PSEU|nr:class I SAM-dependent methyltransferase [Crossiella cryophila]MBB4678289.1 ubiquinone/menaquinone biosynthesis C-methylase UbiE [Crossiella cryophila]
MGRSEVIAGLRAEYAAALAGGTARFFEPRRRQCPWCDSPKLTTRLRTPDLMQHKPGRFLLDECGGCGHVFQNPRLTEEGLDFYYRDFYDRLGEKATAGRFRSQQGAYKDRAGMVRPHTEPKAWLDVGTGHGHFCGTAAKLFPHTDFDGVDMTDGVLLAEGEGRIRQAHQGRFTALSAGLAGQYDVVSMFHYLEHSVEPREEIAAARETLRSGGHLIIEVPDPECRLAKVLGRYWLSWLQPQHLNFVPVGNLCAELAEQGFTVVDVHRKKAHMPFDLMLAAGLFVENLAPRGDAPWLAVPPNPLERLARGAVVAAGMPLAVAGVLLDRLLALAPERAGLTNTYRVLARLS